MVSSLETLCGVPGAVVFANHPDVKKQIFSSSVTLLKFCPQSMKWDNDLQNTVCEVFNDYNPVFKLTIPRHLFSLIGREMLKWVENMKAHFDRPKIYFIRLMKSSFFTSKGLIDEEKAAKELLKESSLSIFLQYEIACHYFIRDAVQSLWQQLHVKKKTFETFLSKIDSKRPVVLWSKYFEKLNNSSISESEFERLSQDFIVSVFSYGTSSGNVSAIKFSFIQESRNNKYEEKEVAEKVRSLFTTCLDRTAAYFPTCYYSRENILLSRDPSVCQDIAIHLFSLVKEENIPSFLDNSVIVYNLLKCLLIWPHQDLFMKTAVAGLNVLYGDHFYYLMCSIADMLEDPILRQTYNYRLLLREFWIKSPSNLKKYVINIHSGEGHRGLLLSKILNPRSFSPDDEFNFHLIMESASLLERNKILLYLGNFCINGIFLENLKLWEFYAKNLSLNEDTLNVFKERYSYQLFSLVAEGESCLDNVDKFFNCLFSTEEISNFKHEFFPRILKRFFETPSLFVIWRSVEHFNKVCKWFGKTDEETEEWKINGTFDEILSNAGPGIVEKLFQHKTFDETFYDKLLFLCSSNEERVSKYIKELHAFCTLYAEEKLCTSCRGKKSVSFNKLKLVYLCQRHPESEIPTSETTENFCTILMRFHNLITEQETKKHKIFCNSEESYSSLGDN